MISLTVKKSEWAMKIDFVTSEKSTIHAMATNAINYIDAWNGKQNDLRT